MTLLREVLGELVSMFVADLRLTLVILALVAVAAALVALSGATGLAALTLVVGAPAILIAAVLAAARG